MEEKWIFLLIINKDRIVTNLLAPHRNIEVESSTWASTTSILLINGNLTRKWKSWEEHQSVLKGQRDVESSM